MEDWGRRLENVYLLFGVLILCCFSNTVWSFAKHLHELAGMVMRMILQSMGVEKHVDSFSEELACGLRLSRYWFSPDEGIKSRIGSHTDPPFLTIVCQHEVPGLEVQTREDSWIRVTPLPNAFTIMLGDAFEVRRDSLTYSRRRKYTNGYDERKHTTNHA